MKAKNPCVKATSPGAIDLSPERHEVLSTRDYQALTTRIQHQVGRERRKRQQLLSRPPAIFIGGAKTIILSRHPIAMSYEETRYTQASASKKAAISHALTYGRRAPLYVDVRVIEDTIRNGMRYGSARASDLDDLMEQVKERHPRWQKIHLRSAEGGLIHQRGPYASTCDDPNVILPHTHETHKRIAAAR